MTYQIYQIDSSHGLKPLETLYERQHRFVLMEADFCNFSCSANCETMEEAIEKIEKYGNDYTEYTVLPRIYKTS